MTEKKFRKVQPCGMLYTFGREYFLLKTTPVEKDSWQHDGAYRWVVVPNKPINDPNYADIELPVYSFARHIVSTAFTVDFSPDMPEIDIWQLEDIDLIRTEWPPEEEYDDSYDLNAHVLMEALGANLDD